MRVLICDDQWIVCQGLEAILSAEPGIEVVGGVSDGVEALDAVARLQPDLVLMDLRMPRMNGIEATRLIREHYPEVKVLVLTTYGSDEWLFEAVRSGASGYLLKGTPREALIDAVKGTAAGRTHIDPEIAGKLLEQVAQRTGVRALRPGQGPRRMEYIRRMEDIRLWVPFIRSIRSASANWTCFACWRGG